jgi:MFS family permease
VNSGESIWHRATLYFSRRSQRRVSVRCMSITVIGGFYATHEPGKVQGRLASVWNVLSVIGPLAGGLIIQHVSWAWVFWIEVPIGLAAATRFFLFLRETVATYGRPDRSLHLTF